MSVEVYKLDQSPNRDIILVRQSNDTAFFPVNAILVNPISITSGSGGDSLGPDLTAIEALTGNNTLYYRTSNGIWNPVTFASNIIFTGGMISGSGLIGPTGAQGIPGTGTVYLSGIISTFTNIIIPKFDLSRPFPHNTAFGHGVPSGTINYPAGTFRGIDDKNTILVFPRQTGYLVSTEEFGRNTLSANLYFGSGNSCQSPVIKGFTIDGSGDINVFPRIYNSGDLYIATGLAIEAMSPQVSNISFYDIRGTSLYIDGPHQTSGDDVFGNYWRGDLAFIKDIYIVGGFAGAVIKSTDTKLENFYSVNVRDIALDIYGASLVMNNSHIYGANTGVAVRQNGLIANNCYWEASKIALDLIDAGNSTSINNFYGGPCTCWYRTIRIGTSSNTLRGIRIDVRQEDIIWPDIAGVEYTDNNTTANHFEGIISLDDSTNAPGGGSTSKGYILRGKQGYHNLRFASNFIHFGTYLQVPSPIQGTQVIIKGRGKGGRILDLSGSTLNINSGYGNNFDITWESTDLVGTNAITGIVYPGGGTAWNLEEGTNIKFQGKQLPQSRDNLVSYWKMNETTGNAIDSYGNNTLIQNNGVSSAAGLVYSTAKSFNGTNQFCDIVSNSSLAIGNKEVLSILTWINLSSKLSYGIILSKDDVSSNREYTLYYDQGNDRISFDLYTGGFLPPFSLMSSISPSINTWYMLYVEYNGSLIKMSLNNSGFSSNSFPYTPFSGTAAFNIGRQSAGTNYYSGLIGPTRIYKRTLTNTERTIFYENGYGFK